MLYHLAFSEFNLSFKLLPEPVIPVDSPVLALSSFVWFSGIPGKAFSGVAALEGRECGGMGGLIH